MKQIEFGIVKMTEVKVKFDAIKEAINKLDFFHSIEVLGVEGHRLYLLEDTEYIFVFVKDIIYNYSTGWLHSSKNWINSKSKTLEECDFKDVSFEEVFETAPDHIKEKLLFHLDLFK